MGDLPVEPPRTGKEKVGDVEGLVVLLRSVCGPPTRYKQLTY